MEQLPDRSLDQNFAADRLIFLSGIEPSISDPLELELFNLKKDIFFGRGTFEDIPELDSRGREFYHYSFGENFPIHVYAEDHGRLIAIAIPEIDYSELTPEDLREMEEEMGWNLDYIKERNEEGIQVVKSFFISNGIRVLEDI